jgi:hypothetical protein
LYARPGTGVAPNSGFAVAYRKRPKAAQLNPITTLKCTANFIKYGADKSFNVAMVKRWIFCR